MLDGARRLDQHERCRRGADPLLVARDRRKQLVRVDRPSAERRRQSVRGQQLGNHGAQVVAAAQPQSREQAEADRLTVAKGFEIATAANTPAPAPKE